MLSKEDMDSIVDKYMLVFLDDYISTFGYIPSEEIRRAWMVGFISGCESIADALRMNQT